MQEQKSDFLAVLRSLAEHHVDFIVVGGVAAVLQGAPLATFDLDIVHSRNPENVDKILEALNDLSALYRTAPNVKPDKSDLSSPGHQLLMTRFGPLDLLGVIGSGRGYNELLRDSSSMPIDPQCEVKVLNLRMVIKTKEEAGHEKDAAGLVVLRRTLEEKTAVELFAGSARGEAGAHGHAPLHVIQRLIARTASRTPPVLQP